MLSQAKVWLRERKERAEEKKAAEFDPPGVTIPLSLVHSAKLASWMAYFALVYFLWLYTLDIARDRSASLHVTHAGSWIGELQFYFPYIIGFAIVAVGIPYVAKIAIPTFMSLSWRDNAWAKGWALFIVVCVSSVIIAGTFTVQGDTILERDRESAVAVEGVQQEAAVLTARIADKRAELDDMVNNESVYVRTAASMSPAAYDVFLQSRRDDWQYDRLVSYRATSVDAQRLRDEIAVLREQQARQTTVAAVQGEVTTERTSWIADTLGWLEGARAMLLSFVMDIVCLIMPWIALRLEQARNRQLGMAGGIPQHPWMLTHQAGGRVNPAQQRAADVAEAMMEGGADPRFAADMARAAASSGVVDEIVCDEDGTPLKKVEYWKREDGKPLVKNQKNRVNVPPGPAQPDETGFVSPNDSRLAMTAAGPLDVEGLTTAALDESVEATMPVDPVAALSDVSAPQQSSHDNGPTDDDAAKSDDSVDDTGVQPELSETDALLINFSDEIENSAPESEADQQSDDETLHQDEPRSEPETDPAKLIGVAAE